MYRDYFVSLRLFLLLFVCFCSSFVIPLLVYKTKHQINWKPGNLFKKYEIVIYDDSFWTLCLIYKRAE